MSSTLLSAESGTFDGVRREELARQTGCASVHLFASLPSTMEPAHALAQSAGATDLLVVAEEQTAGRGRESRVWLSEGGLTFTYISRNPDSSAAQVLALRVGMFLRNELQHFSGTALTLKWPNDILAGGAKLAGILIETRWRGAAPEWSAIGVGINLKAPQSVAGAAGLSAAPSRAALLVSAVNAVRSAASAAGPLLRDEVRDFIRHDALRGRHLELPVQGTALGITAAGELVVSTSAGLQLVRSGTVQLSSQH